MSDAEYSVKATLKIQEYGGCYHANVEVHRAGINPPVRVEVSIGKTHEECLDNVPVSLEAS